MAKKSRFTILVLTIIAALGILAAKGLRSIRNNSDFYNTSSSGSAESGAWQAQEVGNVDALFIDTLWEMSHR
jgi:hypothetical protein